MLILRCRDLESEVVRNVLTATVNGLPTDGSTVCVTLYGRIGGMDGGRS